MLPLQQFPQRLHELLHSILTLPPFQLRISPRIENGRTGHFLEPVKETMSLHLLDRLTRSGALLLQDRRDNVMVRDDHLLLVMGDAGGLLECAGGIHENVVDDRPGLECLCHAFEGQYVQRDVIRLQKGLQLGRGVIEVAQHNQRVVWVFAQAVMQSFCQVTQLILT